MSRTGPKTERPWERLFTCIFSTHSCVKRVPGLSGLYVKRLEHFSWISAITLNGKQCSFIILLCTKSLISCKLSIIISLPHPISRDTSLYCGCVGPKAFILFRSVQALSQRIRFRKTSRWQLLPPLIYYSLTIISHL